MVGLPIVHILHSEMDSGVDMNGLHQVTCKEIDYIIYVSRNIHEQGLLENIKIKIKSRKHFALATEATNVVQEWARFFMSQMLDDLTRTPKRYYRIP
jgi:hypothetical protein